MVITISKKPTLREIALLTNTSINTVSRALNAKHGVSEKTRKYIEQVAIENNYRPNLLARSMRGNNTNLLGIIVGDIGNTFFVQLLEGVGDIAKKENMTIAIGNSAESAEEEAKNVDVFLSYQCAGLAISPVSDSSSIINCLKDENVNFVVLDRPLPEGIECDHVSINNERDSFRATEYLITCGHRDIAIIAPSRYPTEQDRYSGYRKALEKHAIPLNQEYVKFCDNKHNVRQICREILTLEKRPTAIFVALELLSLGVISAVSEFGLKIPEDLSIIVYGDPEWASVFSPPLTCMQRPVREMGQIGASILINRTKSSAGKRKTNPAVPLFKGISLDSKLMIRESVRIIL